MIAAAHCLDASGLDSGSIPLVLMMDCCGIDLSELITLHDHPRLRFSQLYCCTRTRPAGASAEPAKPCPLPLAMVEEYEAYTKRFWAAVHEHMEGGALNLDDLEEGSPLELCYYLVRGHSCCCAAHVLALFACQQRCMPGSVPVACVV